MPKMASTSTDVFTNMFQCILVDLKASPPLWENICSKAVKLATQLTNLANSLGSFINAMQSISDNASNTKGASRDIGASLTRFCLRQKSLENLLRAIATALGESFAPTVQHKINEWRQRVGEIERSRMRALKKSKKTSSICSENSKNVFSELLTEQRNQFIFFVNALLPVTNAEIDVLGESVHVQEVRDSLASAVNENDSHSIIKAILEDAQIHMNSSATTVADSCNSMEDAWQRRISSCSDGTLSKNVSQSMQAMMEDEKTINASRDIFADSYQSQQLPSSSSSISSSGFSQSLHDPYGTIHTNSSSGGGGSGVGTMFGSRKAMELCDNSSQFSSRPRTLTSTSSIGMDTRRIPLSAQTFVQPTHYQGNLLSYKSASPAMPSNNSKPPLPIRQKSHADTVGNSIYSVPLQNNNISNVCKNLSLSTSDISGSASVTELSHDINDHSLVESNSMPRRPLSLSEELPSYSNGRANSTPGHCSTLLIAETLQQIDQLGVELDSYCNTLKPLTTRKEDYLLPLVENNSPNILLQQNAYNFHQKQTPDQVPPEMVTVRYRPTNARQPPPLPERKNLFSNVLTMPPSTANNGNSTLHNYHPQSVQINPTFSQNIFNPHQNFETRKSAQQFDQYNPSRPKPMGHSNTDCLQNVQYYSQTQLREFEMAQYNNAKPYQQ